MSIMTEKEIKYGFTYCHPDEPKIKSIIEVCDYKGESSIEIYCTQLGDSLTPKYKAQKDKKRVLNEWCAFLTTNTTLFTELYFNTRMPQELFNAVCMQKNLKKLIIKWGVYPDISLISNLGNLEYLGLGSGAGVQTIDSLSQLSNLLALCIENFQKISDYHSLAKLNKLESLSIIGNGLSPQYIHVDSLRFLEKMEQLRFFRFMTARLKDKNFKPVLALKNLEHLTLSPSKEVKCLYDELVKLPKLKYGLLKERAEMYLD